MQPFHEPGRPVESLAAIFNIVALRRHRRGHRRWVGGGACAARSARCWPPAGPTTTAVGGHEAVRASVVDDVALAERYRAAGAPGVRVSAAATPSGSACTREGFGQLVEGFTKNLAAGAASVRRSTTLLVVGWLTLLVQAAVAPVRPSLAGDGPGSTAAVVLYARGRRSSTGGWAAGSVGSARVVALAFPVSVALFLVVFARSVLADRDGTGQLAGASGADPRCVGRTARVVEQRARGSTASSATDSRMSSRARWRPALVGAARTIAGAQRRPSSLMVDTSTLR